MKNFTTKLLCFKSLENFVLKIVHCGHNLGAHMKKIGWICPRSRFFLEKKLKKCPDQKMTKGKIVLELVKYAKSAVINFDQSEASIQSHMTKMEASDWSKFSNGRFGMFEQF